MNFFNRFRGGGSPEQPRGPKKPEQKMVFEEVNEGVEDMTFKEDPVEQGAARILSLEEDVEQARFDLQNGGGDRGGVQVKEVLLAKARYEQARQNEQAGRGRKGEADRLLADWQKSQDALEGLRSDQINTVREQIAARYDDDIDADTAAQLRRHP